MSNERDKAAEFADETVSRTYRETADERAPDHLDRAVLKQAARAARPGYARSRAWTRPLAWAATIALSVAIVLELTRVPAPDESAFEITAPPVAVEQTGSFANQASDADDNGATATGRSADVMQDAREKSGLMQKNSVSPEFESVAEETAEAAAPASPPEPAADTPDSTSLEGEIPRRATWAEERQDAPAQQLFRSAEPAAIALDEELADGDPGECAFEATQQPSTWFACIEELERDGFVDEAARERQRLSEAFPGAELP